MIIENYMKKTILIALAMVIGCGYGYAQDEQFKDTIPVMFGNSVLNETLGGVSAINMEALTEKNYNTYAGDNLQGYVGGYNGNSLWGLDDALVLIDGVPRDINNVKPDEIATITFLKGAQAVVLYGSSGAKGVILITTKRGKEGALKIDVRANTGWNFAKSFPEYLGSAEYMSAYNQARVNDGLSPLYSDNDLYNYSSGINPYRYPNVNFYTSDYIKKSFNRSEITAELSGGSKYAKYYANVGFYRQGDMLNFGEAENDYTQRFNVRGNVDLNLNDWITAAVDANVSFYDQKTPAGANFWEAAATFRPNRVSPLIPVDYIDPNAIGAWNMINETDNIFGGCFLGGTLLDKTNVFADFYAAGKSKWTSRQFQFDTTLNFDLSKITKGLSFHTQFGLDYRTSYTTSFNNEYASYEPTWANYQGRDVIVALNNNETLDKKSGIQNVSGSTDDQVISFNAHLDYNRTFNEDHNVSAMVLANGYQLSESGEYHKISNANLGVMAAYNYQNRYFANFSGAIVHSARLAEGHREAFSPSLSLGWNIAKDFLQDTAVDLLMLSASGSILNTDYGIDEFYMHKGTFTQDKNTWWGWREGVANNPTISERGANEDLTFLKRKEFSINLKGSFWNQMLTADVSFFTNMMDGGVISATSMYPIYFKTYYPNSSFIPYMNYNRDTRTGVDFSVNFQKKWDDFYFKAGINGTYYTTNANRRDDTEIADAYQKREGHAIDAIWGYECLGYFKDADDVANSPSQNALSGNVKPGDLKYKDQNNDGIIDSKDQIDLGKGAWYGSPLTLGLNITAKYKNFTLFLLATGGFGGKAVKNNSYWWIDGDDKYSAVVRGAWTPETASTATYPRLTTGDGSNNFQNSTYWLYKTDRFDLAKVQLTYDFPTEWFTNKWVSGMSAFVNGSNLLTIAKEKDILEMNVGSAPQTRFYSLGVKVSF